MSPASHTSINTKSAAHPPQGIQAPAAELREIVKEAYIYGFPMMDNHRIQNSYFVDPRRWMARGECRKPARHLVTLSRHAQKT